jgi:hypothetical protein
MTENTSQSCERCDSREFDAMEGWCKSCGHYNDDEDCQCDKCVMAEEDDYDDDEDEGDEQ